MVQDDSRPQSSPSYRPEHGLKGGKKSPRPAFEVIQVIPTPAPCTLQYGRRSVPVYYKKDHHMPVGFVNSLPQMEGWLKTMHDASEGLFSVADVLRSNWFWAFFCVDGFALQMWRSAENREYRHYGFHPVGWWDMRRLQMISFEKEGKTEAVLRLFFCDGYLELRAQSLSEANRWAQGLQRLVHFYREGHKVLQETEPLWTKTSLERLWNKHDQQSRGELGFHDVVALCHVLIAQERVDVSARMSAGLQGNHLEDRMQALLAAQGRLQKDERHLRQCFGDPVKKRTFVLNATRAVFGEEAHLFTGQDGAVFNLGAGEAYGQGAYGDQGSRHHHGKQDQCAFQ